MQDLGRLEFVEYLELVLLLNIYRRTVSLRSPRAQDLRTQVWVHEESEVFGFIFFFHFVILLPSAGQR